MKKIFSLVILISISASLQLSAQSGEWTKHKAKKWFNQKEWLGGLQLKPHKSIDVDGENVYASVTFDSTKNFDKTTWESHRKYVDLQYIISGEEKIGVYPVSKATVTKEYDDKRDAANYSADGKIYPATPGTFFLFFPSDAHRPNITPGGNLPDKKIVIKVRYTE